MSVCTFSLVWSRSCFSHIYVQVKNNLRKSCIHKIFYHMVGVSRFVNSVNFVDVDHLWNLTPRKTNYSLQNWAFGKPNREKTENWPFPKFKYVPRKNQLYSILTLIIIVMFSVELFLNYNKTHIWCTLQVSNKAHLLLYCYHFMCHPIYNK